MLSVARKVAPTWLEAYSNPSVDTLLTCIEQYLQGKESLDMVYAKTDSLQGELQNGPDGRDDAWLAGSAASCCGWVCFGDEILIPGDWITWDDVYEPDDPDLWDGAFYAAGSYAKGMPWINLVKKSTMSFGFGISTLHYRLRGKRQKKDFLLSTTRKSKTCRKSHRLANPRKANFFYLVYNAFFNHPRIDF